MPEEKNHLSKVLGPVHIWALGVGIVLVGEFMGWNFTVAKGGTLGAIIACWVMGLLYTSLVMVNTEMGSVIPEAGGQYSTYASGYCFFTVEQARFNTSEIGIPLLPGQSL